MDKRSAEEDVLRAAANLAAKVVALETRVRELEAENGRLREAVKWVSGEEVEGWPPFHEFTAAGSRYRWRTVLREKLSAALQGEG